MVYAIILLMKIYVDGLVPDKIKYKNLQGYLSKKVRVMLYYTLSGIYENINGKMYQLEILDGNIEEKKLKGLDINLIVDTSKQTKKHIVYQVPSDYVLDDYTKETFLLRRQSNLVLTLHRKGDHIAEAYIETGEDLDNEHYHEDFVTLISLLTNIEL